MLFLFFISDTVVENTALRSLPEFLNISFRDLSSAGVGTLQKISIDNAVLKYSDRMLKADRVWFTHKNDSCNNIVSRLKI